MFLFHSLHHGSFRRHPARNVFAFVALCFLFTALLFTGCQDGGGGGRTPSTTGDGNQLDENLIGTWTSDYYDGYIITATHLTYTDWQGEISYAGTIRYAADFSDDAGVIIFEYDADHKPTYYAEWDPETYEPIGDPLPLKGNFAGVYYKDLNPGVSVQMGTAYAEGGAEEPTLDAAKKAFALDKEGDYMSYYGTYLK
jgi:hypothetical protein